MSVPSNCSVTSRAVFSIIGFAVGLSIFFTFGLKYENWNTSLWGLLSGLAASVSTYLHVGFQRQIFQTCPLRLQHFMLAGCFIQLAGCCGFVAYLTLAITQHQGLLIYGNGYYLTCIWCIMTWKWGFFLLFYARKYKRLYISEYTILTPHADSNTKYYTQNKM